MMIECGLGSVQSWECDVMGHLNVQHYVARASESLPAMLIPLGFGPRACRALGAELALTEHHIRFLRELRPGTPFIITGGVLAARSDGLTFYQEMHNTLGGTVAATFITETRLVDAETRAPMPLPADVTRRAEAALVALPEFAAPKGLTREAPRPRPTWAEADRLGLALTQQGGVGALDCDRRGLMVTRAVMGRISDAIPNMIAKTRGVDRSEEGSGGAALEYRLVYRATPREGDMLALRSGIKAIGAKTFIWGHWLFDRETGEAVATAAAVAVAFDLATRKSIEISAAMRESLQKHLVPELSL
ncbi:MAG TPA: acyl-ACP thioesterase [Stellaceae bacterium]|nr:acyl-ACP thioesterase [Stellaceae bacterium]